MGSDIRRRKRVLFYRTRIGRLRRLFKNPCLAGTLRIGSSSSPGHPRHLVFISSMLYRISTEREFTAQNRSSQVENRQCVVGVRVGGSTRWRVALVLVWGTAAQWLCPARAQSPDLVWKTNVGSYIVQDSKSIAFSPDGSILATRATNDHTALLRATNGALIRVLTGTGSPAFSP